MKTGGKIAVVVGAGTALGGLACLLLRKPSPAFPEPPPETTVAVLWDGGVTPEFEPGSVHDALVSITNLTEEEWDFTAELWLAGERVQRWHVGLLGLGQTGQQEVSDILMPTASGIWDVDVMVLLTETSQRIAHIRADPVVIIETEPPPAGMLGDLDIEKILEWARCGHYIDAGLESFGIGCWTRPMGAWKDECALEAAQAIGVPELEPYFNLKGYADVHDLFTIQMNLYAKLGAVRDACFPTLLWTYPGTTCLREISYPLHGLVVRDPYTGKQWLVDMDCAQPLWDDCVAEQGADILMSIANLIAWGEAGWPNPMATCCARKAQEYWDGLDDDTKYDMWQKPAYRECSTASRSMNQLYAEHWAPCTADELILHIEALWGGDTDLIERAQWAIAHLEEYPWV